MEFLDSDFAKMRYNVRKITNDQDILTEIPELASLPGFSDIKKIHGGLLRTQIVKYIAFMYDPETPVLGIPDVMKRRFYAATLAEFPKRTSIKFEKQAEEIISGKNKEVNVAAREFIVSFHSAKWSKLVAYHRALEIQLEYLISGGIKKDTIDQVDSLEAGISRMIREMSNDDSAKFVIDSIYEKIRSDKLELRPEDIADKLAEGEDPVDIKPYGDYEFPDNEWQNIKIIEEIPEKR